MQTAGLEDVIFAGKNCFLFFANSCTMSSRRHKIRMLGPLGTV